MANNFAFSNTLCHKRTTNVDYRIEQSHRECNSDYKPHHSDTSIWFRGIKLGRFKHICSRISRYSRWRRSIYSDRSNSRLVFKHNNKTQQSINRTARHHRRNYYYFCYYLLISLLPVNLAKAEDVNNIASPNAIGNSSIINQNTNVNVGATSKNQYGDLVCSQPSLSFTPFYTGNDAESTEGTYSINEGWGMQLSFMIPLGINNDICSDLALVKLELAKEQLSKQEHDKQLVRVLKCAELHAAGYMINPNSEYAYLCADVVNIRTYINANSDLFSSD